MFTFASTHPAAGVFGAGILQTSGGGFFATTSLSSGFGPGTHAWKLRPLTRRWCVASTIMVLPCWPAHEMKLWVVHGAGHDR